MTGKPPPGPPIEVIRLIVISSGYCLRNMLVVRRCIPNINVATSPIGEGRLIEKEYLKPFACSFTTSGALAGSENQLPS